MKSEWEKEATRILKAELALRGLTYAGLVGRLETLGIRETERSIANKLSRGTFPFSFYLQCLHAIGAVIATIRVRSER